MERPINTLFMLSSVDGKISTGDSDELDVDRDFPLIDGVKEGLGQYYEIEKTTDYFSLNSGRVWAKIGLNEKTDIPKKIPNLKLVVIDNKPHLNENGIKYIAKKCEKLIVVTTNKKHPAYKISDEIGNVDFIEYKAEIDFKDMFEKLKRDFGAERVTIQTGGTLNSVFLRSGLIDYVSLVVCPALIGGKDTSTLIDGESLHSGYELSKIKSLDLKSINILKDSYVHFIYKVNN